MEEKLKVIDLIGELNTGELGENFCDYSDGYICDVICKIAGNSVSIYTADLLEWA